MVVLNLGRCERRLVFRVLYISTTLTSSIGCAYYSSLDEDRAHTSGWKASRK